MCQFSLLSKHYDSKSLSPLKLWTRNSPQTSIKLKETIDICGLAFFLRVLYKCVNVPMVLSNHYESKFFFPLILWTRNSSQTSIKLKETIDICGWHFFSDCYIKAWMFPCFWATIMTASLSLWTRESTQTSIETHRNYRYLWIDSFFSDCNNSVWMSPCFWATIVTTSPSHH